MKDTIKPIETIYNGYKFRSRLEARWAVFFDDAGIRYEYEPEGFKTKSGLCYLPDFYLPDENMYVEVKAPRKGAWKELNKIEPFIGNGIETLLILSNIPKPDKQSWHYPIAYYHPVVQDVFVHWVPISSREEDDDGDGFSGIIRSAPTPWIGSNKEFRSCSEEGAQELLTPYLDEDGLDEILDTDNIRVNAAYEKARQARFEFGEKG